jgi:aminoglycoside 3-N-acetyltransferase I
MNVPIVCQKLEFDDLTFLKALISVYEEVFETGNFSMPSDRYLQGLLQREGLIFFAAILEGKVIGGLTAHVLPSVYFESAEVYVYDLAVQAGYQRKGIGRNLMASLGKYCGEQGYREIFVQADLVDQHALDFYQATGGQAERVVHFSYAL